MQSISLFDLNEYIKRVIALNFPDAIWVKCEIAQANTSRGHLYLNLIQKENNGTEIIAQSNAMVWERQLKKLFQEHGRLLFDILNEGVEVNLLVKLNFNERFGFSLFVEDVDTAYSLGKLALERQKTLQQLQKEHLTDRQKKLVLPKVIQKIAVLSSATAAGLADFQAHLAQNIYGYQFNMDLFHVPVQGIVAAKEITNQLKNVINLNSAQNPYDAIIIVRGGGAKTDLFTFDDIDLARAVANCPLPILVGIGHQIDETVLDVIAHLSLKTPTAVADFIIEYNTRFESSVLAFQQQIGQIANQINQYNNNTINELAQKVKLFSSYLLKENVKDLENIEFQLEKAFLSKIEKEKQQLDFLEQLIESYHPKKILERGFTITKQNGKAINSVEKIVANEQILTVFKDGTLITDPPKKG